MTTLLFCLAAAAADPEQQALERKFAAAMTGATLAGSFNIEGKNRPPAVDRYEISKASKLSGSKWEIVARMKWGKFDLKLPVPVEVKWAGDTAMIQVTDLSLLGVPGKFRTRLLIDGDHYAGVWSHDAVTGLMWGKIERTKPDAKPASEAKPSAEAKPQPATKN